MARNPTNRILVIAALWLGTACADAPTEKEPLVLEEVGLAGHMAEEAWTFAQGTSDASLTMDGQETIVLCPASLNDGCGLCTASHQLYITAPPITGVYTIEDDDLLVRFAHNNLDGTLTTSTHVPATRAQLTILSVEPDTIHGGIVALTEGLPGYSLNGLFTSQRCQELTPGDAPESAR